jgi:hypothetical protein
MSDTITPPDGGQQQQQQQQEQPWHSLVLQGEGEAAKLNDPAQWLEKAPKPLSEFIRSNMTAARAKTEGMVRVPGEQATDEERAAFFKALGVPDTEEGYGFTKPEKMPDGVAHDEALEKAFLSEAKKLGLTKAQALGLRDFQVNHVGAQVAARNEAVAKSIEAEKVELKTRFGDKLESTVEQVKALANVKGVPAPFAKQLAELADPSHGNFGGADFLEFAAWVSKAVGEDSGASSFKGGGGSNSVDHWKAVMKEGAKAPEGSALRRDFDLLSKQDPEAVKRYNEAYSNAA